MSEKDIEYKNRNKSQNDFNYGYLLLEEVIDFGLEN